MVLLPVAAAAAGIGMATEASWEMAAAGVVAGGRDVWWQWVGVTCGVVGCKNDVGCENDVAGWAAQRAVDDHSSVLVICQWMYLGIMRLSKVRDCMIWGLCMVVACKVACSGGVMSTMHCRAHVILGG